MGFFTDQEAADLIGIKIDSVQRRVRRGKLPVREYDFGIYQIWLSDEMVAALKREKEIFDGNDYLSGDDLEDMGYSRMLLYTGLLETEKARGRLFMAFSEFECFVKDKKPIHISFRITSSSKTFYLRKRGGVDFKTACNFTRACGSHYRHFKTCCTLKCRRKKWTYPSKGREEAGKLFFIGISNGEKVSIQTKGHKSRMLLNLLIKKIEGK